MNSIPPTKPPRGIKATKETVSLLTFYLFNCYNTIIFLKL